MRYSLISFVLLISAPSFCQWGISAGMITRMEGYSVKSEGIFKNYLTLSPEYEFKRWRVFGDLTFMPKNFTYNSQKKTSSSGSTIGGFWKFTDIRTYIADVKYGYLGVQIGGSRIFNKFDRKNYFSVGITTQLEYLLYEKEHNHRGTYTHINEFNSDNPFQQDTYNEYSGTFYVDPDNPFDAIEASTFYASFSFNIGYRMIFNKFFINLELSPGVFPEFRTINLLYDPYSDGELNYSLRIPNTRIGLLLQGGIKVGYRFDKKWNDVDYSTYIPSEACL